jgi:O-antigen/teichoic acid export membrane protein
MRRIPIVKTVLSNFANREGLRKYAANTSWLMAERILRMAIGLLVGVYIARYLGPVQFGLISYASSFVGLFVVLATLGLDNIVIRELVRKPETSGTLLGTAFWLKLAGTFLMWAAIAAVLTLTENDLLTRNLILVIAFTAVFQAFNVIDFNYQAEVRSKYVVHIQFVQLLVSAIVKLFFIAIEAPLMWFAWSYCLDAVLLATGLCLMYLSTGGRFMTWQWDWALARQLLKDCWPLILSGLVISIYMKIDQVMIHAMLGPGEVGLYAAAVGLSEAWYFIPVVITSSVFPAIINAKRQDAGRYNQQLQKLYDLMVWMAVAIAIPVTFIAPWIIDFLYGTEFTAAAGVLAVHIWAGVFVSLGVASGKWLITENLQFYSTVTTTIGAVINVILNYFFILEIGILGAAISTLISYFIAAYLCLLFFRKTRENFFSLSRSLFFTRILNVCKSS